MLNDRIAAIIARKLSGEAIPDELQELSDHFKLYPADQYFEELLSSYWNSQNNITEEHRPYSEEHFRHILKIAEGEIHEKISEIEVPEVPHHSKKISIINRWSIAAIIAGILFIAWKFVFPHRVATPKQEFENEVTAKKGARSKLLLPDGSQVWLNSDSRLVYADAFSDTIREVQLEGEAYFDVAKDSGRPFIVHTSGLDVRVLGTAFNVKSYASESTIEATLIHGMIEVVKKNQPGSPRLILRPHQKLIFNKAEDSMVKRNSKISGLSTVRSDAAISITALPKNIPDTSIIETSWIYNKLLFEGEQFRDVAVKMERWFNVKITFKNDKVASYRLRGSFVNETIDEALQALQEFVPFTYEIHDGEVEIDKK